MPTAMSNCSLHNGIQHSISMKYQIESDGKKRMSLMCYRKYLHTQSELPVGIELELYIDF